LVGRGTARAEDAQGTPTQSHISPSILVYEGHTTSLPLYATLRTQQPNLNAQHSALNTQTSTLNSKARKHLARDDEVTTSFHLIIPLSHMLRRPYQIHFIKQEGLSNPLGKPRPRQPAPLLLFFTLVTGPRRSLSLKLSDTKVYEPQIRARCLDLHHARSTLSDILAEALPPFKDVSWYTGDIVTLQLLTLGVFP